MWGGELFIPKIPSYRILDVAEAIDSELKHEIIGIRPGEKLHETLINSDEIRYVWDFKDRYILFNPLKSESEIKKEVIDRMNKIEIDFC